MDLQSLSSAYRAKTDEELFQLASEHANLTPEARLALSAELASRKIEPDLGAQIENTGEVFRLRLYCGKN